MSEKDRRKAVSPPLRLDLANECAWRGAERLDLRPKAFAVLAYLVDRRDQLVQKAELLRAIWPDTFVGEAVLTIAVKSIRDALGDDARKPLYLETVHRRGFRWIGDITIDEERRRPSVVDAAPNPIGSDLIGRDDALGALSQAWERARAGKRQLVFVTGEPGIGKTALVDAFEATLRADAPLLLGRGQCLEAYGDAEAYLPILDALESGMRDRHGEDLAETLRRTAPTWFLQFPWLLREDDPWLGAALKRATRERMVRELSSALDAHGATTPIVLLLEDLHWSDPSTVVWLEHFASRRQGARILVVGTYRPVDLIVGAHPLRVVKQHLESRGQCLEIPLAYLSPEEIRAFLGRRLSGTVEDSAVALLGANTTGNPLFMGSLIDQLVEEGSLTRRHGTWAAAPAARRNRPVPVGLRDMVQTRIASLAGDHLALLEVASVAGVEFSSAAVAACLGKQTAEVEEICEDLVRRSHLLSHAAAGGLPDGLAAGRYAFAHALFQNVLYEGIPASRRVDLHRGHGEWGERHDAGIGELAHHFAQAGPNSGTKAVAYATEAAQRAMSVFAHEEAVRHRDAALRAARARPSRRPTEEAELWVALAEARQRAGQIATAEATFYEAAEAARAAGEIRLVARAAIGIARGYPRLFADTRLIQLLERALLDLPEEDHPLRALVMAHLDFALAGLPGDAARRARLAEDALRMARRLDDPETLTWAIQYIRYALHGPRHAEEFREQIDEIQVLLPRVHDAELVWTLRRLLIVNYFELGEIDSVEREIELLRQQAEDAQLPWMVWMTKMQDTFVALLRGELARAARLAEEVVAAGARTEDANVGPFFAGCQTALHMGRGQLAELLPIVRQALEEHPNLPAWHAALAYLCFETGQIEEARRHFEIVAKDDFRQVPEDSGWFVCASFAALACHALEEKGSAAALYAKLLPFRERTVGYPAIPTPGHMGRFLGLLAATAGEPGTAASHFERSIEHNAKMGALPWEALARYDYAVTLVEQGSAAARRRAAKVLAPALAIAHRIGMQGWIPRMEEVAARARQ